jgi:peptide/nickel transport system substrate-binding protein
MAFVGGGQSETLNPMHAFASDIDIARQFNLFDSLVTPGRNGAPQLQLAESIEHNGKATIWTIRLRQGVEWHDGKPVTADDVMYSFEYMCDPKNGAYNVFIGTFLDLKGMKKRDNLTVELPTAGSFAYLPEILMSNAVPVIQAGATDFAHPIGTGPFKFVSWTKGSSSVFARNPHYWQSGVPYVDTLEMVSIPNTTARVNALLGGNVDGAIAVPYSEAVTYQSQGSNSPIKIFLTPSPEETYITMGTATKPFDDVRVRQAMRLIADRPAIIKQAESGLGKVLNDLYGIGYPLYNDQLPQRTQDIEQAKFLLKKAGYEGLKISLSSSTWSVGQLESATVFAQQATAAGVTINVRNLPPSTYYSIGWPKYQFGQTQWEANTIPYTYSAQLLPGAANNDTQWADTTTVKLLREALADPNPTTSQDKWFELQSDLWHYGAQLHWGTSPLCDALSKKVGGAYPNPYADFSNFTFKEYWLT